MSTLIGVALLVGLLWAAVSAYAAKENLIAASFVAAAVAVLFELLRGRHN
ncbi:hypothetical protein [Variovorax sp. LT1R16]